MGIIVGKFNKICAEQFIDIKFLCQNVTSLADFREATADGRSVAEVILENYRDNDSKSARNAMAYYGWVCQEDTRLGQIAMGPPTF